MLIWLQHVEVRLRNKWPYLSEPIIKVGPKHNISWKNPHQRKVRRTQISLSLNRFPSITAGIILFVSSVYPGHKEMSGICRLGRSGKISGRSEAHYQLPRTTSSAAGHRTFCSKNTRKCPLRAWAAALHQKVSQQTSRKPHPLFHKRQAPIPEALFSSETGESEKKQPLSFISKSHSPDF